MTAFLGHHNRFVPPVPHSRMVHTGFADSAFGKTDGDRFVALRWGWRGPNSPPLSLPPFLVPPFLAGCRSEVDDIEAATVRVPQRLRHIVLVLCATSAWAYVVGVLADVRWLSHQLGNGCDLAEQIPGPWQLLQTLQFGCLLLE